MSVTLIRKARLIDPAGGIDDVRDLLVAGGRVVRAAQDIPLDAALEHASPSEAVCFIEADGLWLMPGLVDVHVHFREPGFTAKETLATGSRAAAAGGYTSVVCEPNTEPPIATVDIVRGLAEKASREADVHVYFKAAMTAGRRGREPADIAALAREDSVVALSDDGDPVVDPDVMARVCRLAATAGMLLAPHCEDSPRALEEIAAGADPGFQPGGPYANEARYIERDLRIAAKYGCRIHFSHVSLAESIRRIEGCQPRTSVTCEVTPHHLLLCAEDYAEDAMPRVNPPIRSAADREALRRALTSGSADAIASDHAPHTRADKDAGACGLIGLETTFGLVLTHLVGERLLSASDAVRLMSLSPARIFGLPAGSLSPGQPADMALVDPNMEWTVRPELFHSRSRNTPYAGWQLRGKVVATYVGGSEVYSDSVLDQRKDVR